MQVFERHGPNGSGHSALWALWRLRRSAGRFSAEGDQHEGWWRLHLGDRRYAPGLRGLPNSSRGGSNNRHEDLGEELVDQRSGWRGGDMALRYAPALRSKDHRDVEGARLLCGVDILLESAT